MDVWLVLISKVEPTGNLGLSSPISVCARVGEAGLCFHLAALDILVTARSTPNLKHYIINAK